MRPILFVLVALLLSSKVQPHSVSCNRTGGIDVLFPDTTKHGIKFERGLSWHEIIAKARAENKLIFMDCYTTWCGPCKRMDKEVYPNDSLGDFMNSNFISVKVQMDSTGNDEQEVKKWYADSRSIAADYNVTAYPSFLFFTSEGKFIYKATGFRSASEFAKVGKNAMDPKNILYYNELEAFKRGEKHSADLYGLANYAHSLGDVNMTREIAKEYLRQVDRDQLVDRSKILFVLDVAGDRPLADSLAKVYKAAYLDRLSDTELLKRENFEFIEQFLNLISTEDRFFYLCYNKPAIVDQVAGYPGWSKVVLNMTITREELESKALKNGKPSIKNLQWNKMEENIQRKYPAINAGLLVLDFKIEYYKMLMDWPVYTQLLVERVEKYGPSGLLSEADFNLNNHAWEVFLHSNKRRELEKALTWSDRAVNILLESTDQSNLANWMDTKANILYKLGRVDEAIALEKKVIAIDPASIEFRENLQKMKKGEKTSPE